MIAATGLKPRHLSGLHGAAIPDERLDPVLEAAEGHCSTGALIPPPPRGTELKVKTP